MRIHALGIIGGIVGVSSLGLTWITVTLDGETVAGTAFDVFALITLLAPAFNASPGLGISIILLVVGVILAVIGAIASFLHPVGGGALVAAGIAGTIGAFWFGQALSALPGASASVGFGVLLALAAGAIALGGYGVPSLVVWPRPTAPPPTPFAAPPTLGSAALSEVPPPPSPLHDPLPPAVVTLGASPQPAPGWVTEIQGEIRGLEEAIAGERVSLSRIEGALANGDIDNPTHASLSRDHSDRLAALERHLVKKRLEREVGERAPPPPD